MSINWKKYVIFYFVFLTLFFSLFQATASGEISTLLRVNSQGSIAYPTNLAIIPDKWAISYFSNLFLDSTNVHTPGKPSIRIEPTGTSGNTAREAWGPWYYVSPGDHIVAKCWIRIDALPSGYTYEDFAGARIGIDLRNAASGRGAYCLASCEASTYPETDEMIKNNYVHYGTVGWVQRTIDFIVPSNYYTRDLYTGNTLPSMRVNSVSFWMQVWSGTYGNNEPGNAWFAEAELYINP